MKDDIDFAACMETVARALLGEPSSKRGHEWRYGTNGSLCINLKTGTFFDHETKEGGGVLDLIKLKKKIDNTAALEYLHFLGCISHIARMDKPRPKLSAEALATLKPNGNSTASDSPCDAPDDPFKNLTLKNTSKPFRIVKTWTYTDESGADLFEVCRKENGDIGPDGKPIKTYCQRHKTQDVYVNNITGIRQIPYKLPALLQAVAQNNIIFITEGEKCADAVAAAGGAATCNAMGAGKWPDVLVPFFKGADAVILPDNDAPGASHGRFVAGKLQGVARRVRVLQLPGLPPKGDVADWIEAGGTLARLNELVANSTESKPSAATAKFIPAYAKSLIRYNGAELLEKEFPARAMILSPWLPEKGLALLFSERGVGKTWVAMNIAYSVAGGGSFLDWQAPQPRRVVYPDGEMPASVIKDRFSRIVTNASFDAPEDNFQLVAADVQADGLPDLADPGAQQFYDDAIADAALIILDNQSTICRGLRENEADSYGPVQEWSLRQRAAGRAVLLVHHANKTGSQRGSNKKEDVLDTVVELRRPPGYDASQGARFEVHFTKSRGFIGNDAKPFEAWLKNYQWEKGDINTNCDAEAIRTFHEEGMSVRDIADRLGIPKSTVAFKLKAAK